MRYLCLLLVIAIAVAMGANIGHALLFYAFGWGAYHVS
jgi:hypothetical protein